MHRPSYRATQLVLQRLRPFSVVPWPSRLTFCYWQHALVRLLADSFLLVFLPSPCRPTALACRNRSTFSGQRTQLLWKPWPPSPASLPPVRCDRPVRCQAVHRAARNKFWVSVFGSDFSLAADSRQRRAESIDSDLFEYRHGSPLVLQTRWRRSVWSWNKHAPSRQTLYGQWRYKYFLHRPISTMQFNHLTYCVAVKFYQRNFDSLHDPLFHNAFIRWLWCCDVVIYQAAMGCCFIAFCGRKSNAMQLIGFWLNGWQTSGCIMVWGRNRLDTKPLVHRADI